MAPADFTDSFNTKPGAASETQAGNDYGVTGGDGFGGDGFGPSSGDGFSGDGFGGNVDFAAGGGEVDGKGCRSCVRITSFNSSRCELTAVQGEEGFVLILLPTTPC
jgi:hypothetical protein